MSGAENFFNQARGIVDYDSDEEGRPKDISGKKLREYAQADSDLVSHIDALMDPKAKNETMDRIIDDLNARWDGKEEPHGEYEEVFIKLPSNIRFKIKIYKEMDNAMSFGWDML